MRLLVCGLNPSVRAADAGVGLVTPGNRFWPAALAAGLVTRDRDPRHALLAHGVGMTDLVKRATPRAAELTRDEYRAGVERLGRLCAWLRHAGGPPQQVGHSILVWKLDAAALHAALHGPPVELEEASDTVNVRRLRRIDVAAR